MQNKWIAVALPLALAACAPLPLSTSAGAPPARHDPRLSLANYNRLEMGRTTKAEVERIFGPADPYTKAFLPMQRREVWEYKWLDYQEKRVFWFQFSDDGVLREAMNSRDDANETPGGDMP